MTEGSRASWLEADELAAAVLDAPDGAAAAPDPASGTGAWMLGLFGERPPPGPGTPAADPVSGNGAVADDAEFEFGPCFCPDGDLRDVGTCPGCPAEPASGEPAAIGDREPTLREAVEDLRRVCAGVEFDVSDLYPAAEPPDILAVTRAIARGG
jgi:hypothetical protein